MRASAVPSTVSSDKHCVLHKHLPYPSIHRPKKVSSNKILDFFANCPDNAFQKVRPGTDPFTVGQRFGAIARNGLKLLGVGFFASLLGGSA